jgi:ankyrin repeat protein
MSWYKIRVEHSPSIIVELLLLYHSEQYRSLQLHALDHWNCTRLHYACEASTSATIFQLLLGHDDARRMMNYTVMNAIDHDGDTPLHLLCHCRDDQICALKTISILQQLLQQFPFVLIHTRNQDDQTPLDVVKRSLIASKCQDA